MRDIRPAGICSGIPSSGRIFKAAGLKPRFLFYEGLDRIAEAMRHPKAFLLGRAPDASMLFPPILNVKLRKAARDAAFHCYVARLCASFILICELLLVHRE